jgi:cytochrome bd-type quinol oxidase subunit 2
MTPVLWSIIAILAAFGVAMFVLRRAQRRIPPLILAPGESIPTTALQRLARTSLLLATLLALAAGTIVVYHGAQVFWDNDQVRLTVTGLLIAALGVFAVYSSRVALWIAKDDGTLDERDRAILESAPAGQAPAMLVTLAVWMIALAETYRDSHLVPSVFLYLIFWSCLMVSVLMLIAGVVIGYRRQ